MLILHRRHQSSMTLKTSDGPVRVHVFNAERDKSGEPGVKIGIDAPRSVKVIRDESADGQNKPDPKNKK